MKFGLNDFDADFAVSLCENYRNIMEKKDRTAKEELQYFIGKQLLYFVQAEKKIESEFFEWIYVKGDSNEEYSNEFNVSTGEMYRRRVRLYKRITKLCWAVLDYLYDDFPCKQADQIQKDVKKKLYLAGCEHFIQRQDYLWSTQSDNFFPAKNGDTFYRDLVCKIKNDGIEDLIQNNSDMLNKYRLREVLHVDQFLAEFGNKNK